MIPIDGVGVTVGAFLTRVANAGIVQLAQQSWHTVQRRNYKTLDCSHLRTSSLGHSGGLSILHAIDFF